MNTALNDNKYPFQLQDVRLFELSLQRFPPETSSPKQEMRFEIRVPADEPEADNTDFLVQLVLDLPISDEDDALFAAIHVIIEGKFTVEETGEQPLTPEAVDEFKSRSAFFILYPYLRQMLDDIVTRARLDIPPLPIVSFNAFSFSPPDTP